MRRSCHELRRYSLETKRLRNGYLNDFVLLAILGIDRIDENSSLMNSAYSMRQKQKSGIE